MKDGSMFAVLDGYKEQAFYEEHPSLLLLTPEGSYEATVFSAYVAPAAGDAWQLDFEDDADFSARLDSVAANSVIETGVSPGAEDRVLRLSTCSYEYNDARLVVHTVLRPRADAGQGG
jgi:sortase B